MFLSDIVIILCRASEPGNVGAVCRVMKNMGLSQLRMVAAGSLVPQPSPRGEGSPLDEAPLLARAVHAEDIWQNARFFDTLAEAAADCSLVVGTTRRRGKRRKNVTMEPRALAEWLAQDSAAVRTTASAPAYAAAPVALVFGNERTGLEEEELNFCNIASHVPVSDAFPSLNLSHAVQIYAYEMFLAFGGSNDISDSGAVKGEWIPLERAAVDQLTADITNILAEIGFYKHPGREEQYHFLRDIISRAGLTEREGQYLKNIFAKAGGIVKRQTPHA